MRAFWFKLQFLTATFASESHVSSTKGFCCFFCTHITTYCINLGEGICLMPILFYCDSKFHKDKIIAKSPSVSPSALLGAKHIVDVQKICFKWTHEYTGYLIKLLRRRKQIIYWPNLNPFIPMLSWFFDESGSFWWLGITWFKAIWTEQGN